jgi:hypothetical protein
MIAFTIKFVIVLVFMILQDIAWAMYVIKVDKRDAVRAGAWSSLIMVFGSYVAISYIGDHKFIIAAVLGSFIGTYITVKYHDTLESFKK